MDVKVVIDEHPVDDQTTMCEIRALDEDGHCHRLISNLDSRDQAEEVLEFAQFMVAVARKPEIEWPVA